MIEFIQRYWLEVFFGCIVSALSLVVRTIWARIQRETEEQQVMKEAALAMMHDRLYSLARVYLKQGWATIQDLDNMEHIYSAYHDLGGNGTGTELFNRCRALPIKTLNIANALKEEE